MTTKFQDRVSYGIPKSLSDLDHIVDYDHEHFPYPWTKEQWQELSASAGEYLLGQIHLEGKLAAFSLYLINQYESLAHLLKILVHPDFRHRGLAQELLQSDEQVFRDQKLENIYLEVAEDNHEALQAYLRFGFTEVHRQRHYYSDGKGAVMMIKQIGALR